jgi:hypothetical protein
MVRDRCGPFHRPTQSERAEFLACLALVAGAMLLNSYVATIEDDWPGGFNNPDPQPSNAQRRVAQITEGVLRILFGKSVDLLNSCSHGGRRHSNSC